MARPRRDIFAPREDAVRRRDLNAEARRQAAIVDYVRAVAPQIVIFAVPNGGLRTRAEAARLKWTGTLAGVFDLVLVLPRGGSAFWETKTPAGRLSEEQKAFRDRLIGLDHRWAMVRSIDDARLELLRLGVATREVAA